MDPKPGGRVAVSVVVPVHNPGKFIEPCIDSLLGQSLPNDQYELVFVDDGSTDETPSRLDELAAREPNVRVIHEPASGWAGRPRNVGIDAAVGDYIYFCDHDDWLGPEALERMVNFADATGADVLDAKTIGHRRGVPHGLYRENDTNATLWTRSLMTSLSPHKMFRRGFLNEHRLRFPEGRRRLEDHVFVVQSYFLAKRIAVLADYVCYHHIRRDDDSNAGYGLAEPATYYRYVREVIDIIEAHTEPGPQRDQVLERPFTHEMLGRLSRPRRVGQPPDGYYESVFREVRALMLERFPPDFADRLALVSRVRAELIRADQFDAIVEVNRRLRDLRADVVLSALQWRDGVWRAEVEAQLVLADGSPVRFEPVGDDRWRVDPVVLPDEMQAAHEVTTTELLASRASVVVVERATDEEWFVPAEFTAEVQQIEGEAAHRVVVRGTAELDPATLAGGRPLMNGIWDVSVRLSCLGLGPRARLGVNASTARPLPTAAVIGPRPVTVIPYLTETYENLTLDVGQRVHTLLETLLARPVGAVTVTRDEFEAPVDIDIAPGASPRSLRLQLRGGETVVGHCDAAIVAGPDGAVLRGGAVPKAAGSGLRSIHGAGRYTMSAQSRARDDPSLLGVVELNRHGRIVAADFSLAQRESVVPLPSRYGKRSLVQLIGSPAARLVRRVRRATRAR